MSMSVKYKLWPGLVSKEPEMLLFSFIVGAY